MSAHRDTFAGSVPRLTLSTEGRASWVYGVDAVKHFEIHGNGPTGLFLSVGEYPTGDSKSPSRLAMMHVDEADGRALLAFLKEKYEADPTHD